MGCDIHMIVEVKRDGKWESLGRGYDDRNYDVFAILADVRNGRGFAGCATGGGFVPICDTRGIPEDARLNTGSGPTTTVAMGIRTAG